MPRLNEKMIIAEEKVADKDYLIKLCKKYQIKNWRTVYNAPYNKEFRKKFPDPDLIQPGYIFRVPDKKKTIKVIIGTIRELKVKEVELKKISEGIKKKGKERNKNMLEAANKSKDIKNFGRVVEGLAMSLIPMAGAAKVAMMGTKAVTVSARGAAGILISKGILASKLTAMGLDKESSSFARIVSKASDFTSPSYWATSLWSDKGMDHSDFKKAAKDQIKIFDGQDKKMQEVIAESLDTTRESVKKMEAILKDIQSK